jgi:GNAT superfamily N-acetyltransferase
LNEKPHYAIREVQEGKDEARLAQIFSECFAPPSTGRQVSRWLRQAKQSPLGSKSFVCEVDGEVVSNVSVDFKALHLGEDVYVKTGGIAGVCTCSDYRRRGIMTDLMEKSLAHVKNAGASTSALYTSLAFPAHRIYERCGFSDIQTWPIYVKILNFPHYFRTWLRGLNRHLKFSKIGRKTLQNWNRTVVFELENGGVHSFRFRHGTFRRLSKPPKSADIIIATSVEMLLRVMWGAIKLEDAINTSKVQVRKGNEPDLRILRKILIRVWDE